MAREETKGEVNVLDYSIYRFYLEYQGIPKKYKVKTWAELRKMIYRILTITKKNLIRRKAGVVIKNLGYFFVWMSPRKSTYFDNHGIESYNYHTDFHNYYLVFKPFRVFRGWQMDYCFTNGTKGVTRQIARNLKNGKKYKSYIYSIKK